MSAQAQASIYDVVARSLHWTMAVLIVIVFALGLIGEELPESIERLVVETHKDLGFAILVLLALRLAWRLVRRPPPFDPELSPAVRKLSGFGHLALYGLMLLVPLSGLLFVFWRGQGLDLGFFAIPSPFVVDRPTARFAKEAHELVAFALIGLSALHAGAALFHHVVLKDRVLRRMLPAS
jgi:cytochrome b561